MEPTPRETLLTISVANSFLFIDRQFYVCTEFELCLYFNIAQKTSKISLLDRKSTVETKGHWKKQEGTMKNKRALVKTKRHSAFLFWVGENAEFHIYCYIITSPTFQSS